MMWNKKVRSSALLHIISSTENSCPPERTLQSFLDHYRVEDLQLIMSHTRTALKFIFSYIPLV